MTQLFDESGTVVPVTIIEAGPCFVTQIKTTESDGYNAVQVGFGETKERRLTGGQKGHLGLLKSKKNKQRKKSANIPAVRYLREFRTKDADNFEIGQALTVEQFEEGERVDVVGKTKGRGFAGVVKRHGFAGGVRTHGQSDRHRAPGSVGSTSSVGRVFKGKRMAGRMGNDRYTAQNLTIMRIDADKNLIAVKGAVPGVKGGLVLISDASKG
jgi:large subunit ribosomal protein L3